MDEKTLRKITTKCIGWMLIIAVVSIGLNRYKKIAVNVNKNTKEEVSFLKESNQRIIKEITDGLELEPKIITSDILSEGKIKELLGKNYIKIEKPDTASYHILLEDLYMMNSIKLTLSGMRSAGIQNDKIWRFQNGLVYQGSPEKKVNEKASSNDLLKGLEIQVKHNTNNSDYNAEIMLKLDKIYISKLYESKENIYIDLTEPHSVYDRVIVVDAGHGGQDAGTYSENMEYLEKDLNLSILFYLKEFLDQEDIKVYYTRFSDEKQYLKPRVNLANSLKADFFVSIHCNAADGDSRPKGTEVLYNTTQSGLPFPSQQLAEIFLDEVVKTTGLKKRGIVKGDEIYIVGHSQVPVALIEAGFLTNREDLAFLLKEENRKKIAKGIYNGIMRAYERMEG